MDMLHPSLMCCEAPHCIDDVMLQPMGTNDHTIVDAHFISDEQQPSMWEAIAFQRLNIFLHTASECGGAA